MMKKIRKYLNLLGLNFVVSWRNFVEWCKVVYRYYPNPDFRKIDIYILRNYILQNPYRICKEFLKDRGEKNVYTYGETPLTTLEKIVKECNIGSQDVFYELGSGRGRSCFWIKYFVKCRVVGVEYVPDFVKIASKAGRLYEVDDVKFVYRDILDADISDATVIYFYGTSSETPFIMNLIEKLKKLPSGTKIITVSYPLTAYSEKPVFELVKTFPAEFTWGEADVYLQVRK